jgi:hypothetical protein
MNEKEMVMPDVVVTRDRLLDMAVKLRRTSERQHGTPVLEDAAELLEITAHRFVDLEDRLSRWEKLGRYIDDARAELHLR